MSILENCTATIKECMVFNLLPVAVVTMRFGISAPLSIMVWSVTVRVPVTVTITITVMGICFGIGVSLRIGSRFYFGFFRFSTSPFPAIVTTVTVTTITTVTSITAVITSVVSFGVSCCISCCVSWGQSNSGKEEKTCNLKIMKFSVLPPKNKFGQKLFTWIFYLNGYISFWMDLISFL